MDENMNKILSEIEEEIRKIYGYQISKTCKYILEELFKYAKGEEEVGLTDQEIDNLLLGGVEANRQYQKIKEDKVNSEKYNLDSDKRDYNKQKLRAFLVLKRYLNMINFFQNNSPYKNDFNIIDYYLFDNELKEISNIGLSFYFNIKFWKDSSEKRYIYRCEGLDHQGSWKYMEEPVLNKDVLKDKREFLKLVFYFITVHIARKFGEENNYKALFCSYSKCFGRDLYHYCYTNDNEKVKIVIQPSLEINTIQYQTEANEKEKVSLQEFIWNNDINLQTIKDFNFCISTCDVRDYDNQNYNNWSDSYQILDYYKHSNEKAKKLNAIQGTEELIKKYCVSQNNFNESVRKTLGERIMGTIPDKEIVMSYDYETRKKMTGFEEFEFSRKDLLILIYEYFKRLCEENSWKSLNGNLSFGDKSKFNEYIINNLNGLKEKIPSSIQEKLNNHIDELVKHIGLNEEKINDKEICRIIYEKINWETELSYMKEIYKDMGKRGNKHISHNYMYGLKKDKDKVSKFLISGVKLVFYFIIIMGNGNVLSELYLNGDDNIFYVEER